jgi:Uncharacterized protein conserved in bacteria
MNEKKDLSMSDNAKLMAYVVSDSIGQSAVSIARAALNKFTGLEYIIKDYTFITDFSEIDKIITELDHEKETTVVFHTFANQKMAEYLEDAAKGICDDCYDILTPIVSRVGEVTGLKSNSASPEPQPALDEQYFDRITALEFAVAHDDGKEPKGFLEADIVILGISRTSKTPLSIYLANNTNYKVANLPLMPESELPEEIWEVDSRRIIGLTNDVEVLSEIRKERMIAYGLNPETIYSDKVRIKNEIDYANELYEELNCKIINVANKSIEETASMIMNYLNEEGLYHVIKSN